MIECDQCDGVFCSPVSFVTRERAFMGRVTCALAVKDLTPLHRGSVTPKSLPRLESHNIIFTFIPHLEFCLIFIILSAVDLTVITHESRIVLALSSELMSRLVCSINGRRHISDLRRENVFGTVSKMVKLFCKSQKYS